MSTLEMPGWMHQGIAMLSHAVNKDEERKRDGK